MITTTLLNSTSLCEDVAEERVWVARCSSFPATVTAANPSARADESSANQVFENTGQYGHTHVFTRIYVSPLQPVDWGGGGVGHVGHHAVTGDGGTVMIATRKDRTVHPSSLIFTLTRTMCKSSSQSGRAV